MKSTITDVARRAGVSMKTVSRVMNNEPSVSKATREKVKSAARELDYTPNLAARRLASSKSYLIAMLYDIPSPGYVINIQKGATTACREFGYHLVVEPLETMESNVMADIETLLGHLRVDGVILAPPLCDNGEVVSLLARRNIPYIPIAPSTQHGDVQIVKMDDVRAAREMTEYLIRLGHTDIGFVKGHPRHSASALRFQGFREAMRKANLRINPDWIEEGLFTYKCGVEAAGKILSQSKKPSAIFACNDDMAAGIIASAMGLGLKVPEDLSVCGFDDSPLADSVWPRLTTIRQPVREMGYMAASLLLGRQAPQKNKAEQLVFSLDHALIERESTRSKS
ncbi:MAG: LacI family DNA-binding transcriptional regulator [Hellea sp.]|nr:LacI family DNA-binding transcriptional regulator [Hellea sp.]